MLPQVIDEQVVFPFKFWFNDSIHQGMYYRQELFYRLYRVDVSQRAKLYHLACKLMRQQTLVMLSLSDLTCSLWVSLRSPVTSLNMTEPATLALIHSLMLYPENAANPES